MKYTYYPQGTCSMQIDFELDENNVIGDVAFTGGCHGNLQARHEGHRRYSKVARHQVRLQEHLVS